MSAVEVRQRADWLWAALCSQARLQAEYRADIAARGVVAVVAPHVAPRIPEQRRP